MKRGPGTTDFECELLLIVTDPPTKGAVVTVRHAREVFGSDGRVAVVSIPA